MSLHYVHGERIEHICFQIDFLKGFPDALSQTGKTSCGFKLSLNKINIKCSAKEILVNMTTIFVSQQFSHHKNEHDLYYQLYYANNSTIIDIMCK